MVSCMKARYCVLLFLQEFCNLWRYFTLGFTMAGIISVDSRLPRMHNPLGVEVQAHSGSVKSTPALTYLERSSIPVEQFLCLLSFEHKGKLADLPGVIGERVRYRNQ